MAEQNGSSGGLAMISDNVRRMMTKDAKKTVFYLSKLFEVIFIIITLTLVSYAFEEQKIRRNFLKSNEMERTIIFTTLYGYLLINLILVASRFFGDELPKRMLIIFSGVASILCCITGAVLIVDFTKHEGEIHAFDDARNELLGAGIIAIFASITFAVETMLTYKYP